MKHTDPFLKHSDPFLKHEPAYLPPNYSHDPFPTAQMHAIPELSISSHPTETKAQDRRHLDHLVHQQEQSVSQQLFKQQQAQSAALTGSQLEIQLLSAQLQETKQQVHNQQYILAKNQAFYRSQLQKQKMQVKQSLENQTRIKQQQLEIQELEAQLGGLHRLD